MEIAKVDQEMQRKLPGKDKFVFVQSQTNAGLKR